MNLLISYPIVTHNDWGKWCEIIRWAKAKNIDSKSDSEGSPIILLDEATASLDVTQE